MGQRTANRAWITDVDLVMDQVNVPTHYNFTMTVTYHVGTYQQTVSGSVTSATLTHEPDQTVVGTYVYSGDAKNISWGVDNDGLSSAGMDTIWAAIKAGIIAAENLNVDGDAVVINLDGTTI